MIDRSPLRICLLLAGMLVAAGCSREEPITGPPIAVAPGPAGLECPLQFRQVDSPALAQIRYRNGRPGNVNSMLEIVGGGVACFDFDLDGHCDLYFPQGGSIDGNRQLVSGVDSHFLRGGSGTSFDCLPKAIGASVGDLYSHGATTADYDHDGFDDLLVTGYHGVRLLRNQGDGTFRDTTQDAGLDQLPWTTAAAWGDLNGDGHVDLYFASYVDWSFSTNKVCPTRGGVPDVCSPNVYDGSPDHAFFNRGDGTFALRAKLPDRGSPGKGLGVLTADLQQDGRTEVFVANDLNPNFLYQYRNGQFVDNGLAAGIAVDAFGQVNASMGIGLLDFDLDQKFDLAVTNFENEQIALYKNDGRLLFRHVSQSVGLSAAPGVVGFGIAASDFDCDGDEDLFLTSGHVQYYPDQGPMRQLPLLLENRRGVRFTRCQTSGCRYLEKPRVGRGLATVDFDNDGDLDVVVTHLDEPPALLENTRGNGNRWLRLRLVGRHSSRTPLGAIVRLSVGDRKMVRQLYGGGSYLSQSQKELFFGWETGDLVKLTIQWPSGAVTKRDQIAANQRLTVVEPRIEP